MPIPSSPWIRESNLSLFQRLALNIITIGKIPRHIAIIMDGNRRFADKSSIARKEGHAKGFDKLSETLQWCMDIGVHEVTVYAFSIENFKRSNDEVEALMSLAEEKFEKLLNEKDKLHEKGICIRIIGNLSLLPKTILKSMAEAMILTKDNKSAILNVAFSYTSRDEITNTISTIADGIRQGDIELNDINTKLLDQCLYTNHSIKPDLLVRTSGELRFSDFLLWQSASSVVYFTKVLWPEFNIWHLLGAILYYQTHVKYIRSTTQSFDFPGQELDKRFLTFVQKVEKQREFVLVNAMKA